MTEPAGVEAGTVRRGLAGRLLYREYLPWLGAFAAWLVLIAGFGVDPTLQLAAALLVLSAARGLTRINVRALIRQSRQAVDGRTRALAVSLLSMAAGGLALAALVGILALSGHQPVVRTAILLSLGFPARYLLGLTRRPQGRIARYRIASSAAGLSVVVLATLSHAGWTVTVAAFALREWAGLAAAMLPAARPDAPMSQDQEPKTGWRELASATRAQARRRMARINARLLLHGLLGPFSGLVMRTGRTARIDRHVARWLPNGPWMLGAAATALFAAALAILFSQQSNLKVLLGCLLLRSATAIAAAVIWAWLADADASPNGRADREN